MAQSTQTSRILVAALRGGAGKTFATVGLAAALRRRGLSLSVFKKGPDYIDAGWLGLSTGAVCYNLDPYLFDVDAVRSSFALRSASADLSIVEGNRGLFDGVDSAGTYSTAELAKLLKCPVILLMDVTKMTRTAAALALGCKHLDPDVRIGGVIINRVAGARHERVLRESIEAATSIPVLGSIRKLALSRFPQRHLGLLPWHEHPQALGFVEEAATIAEECIDLDAVLTIAAGAGSIDWAPGSGSVPGVKSAPGKKPLIGVLRDSAFQFYYPENLEALERHGAELVEISALDAPRLPEVDALYIGGGFPETHAQQLAGNVGFRVSLKEAVEQGTPVYAECGGLMYLSRSLIIDENEYPMVGVFPVDTLLDRKPQGHGYVKVEVTRANPFFAKGSILTGHEFHYSLVAGIDKVDVPCAFNVLRGFGLDGKRDGMCLGNVLATYVHLHALGEPAWAASMVAKARERQLARASVAEDAVGATDKEGAAAHSAA